MSDHLLFLGTDGETDFLLTVWDTDELDLATRPADSQATWSPPVRLRRESAEVTA